MAKLKCVEHKKRVHVLDRTTNYKVIHRSDGDLCVGSISVPDCIEIGGVTWIAYVLGEWRADFDGPPDEDRVTAQ